MDSKRAIILFTVLSLGILTALALFNYQVDPLCYYRCEGIETGRINLNNYYRNLQRILLYPDTELIVLGSSRGESLPLASLASTYRLKALNLSVGGADIHAKYGFLRLALQHLRLKKVLWIADYFELIDENTSEKVILTPALRTLAFPEGLPHTRTVLRTAATLIEHNTIEAALALLRGKKLNWPPGRGENADLDLARCRGLLEQRKLSETQLLKEVNMIFDGYANKILLPEQNPQSLAKMRAISRNLAERGIDLVIIIPPYHPEFMRRLQKERPQIFARHQIWVAHLKGLTNAHTEIRDFFADKHFSSDTPRYWTDGVHFNCHAAAAMLLPESAGLTK